MSGSMRDAFKAVPIAAPHSASGRSWRDVSGAWLGIGTSPGALLIGAGLAARYGGPIPLISLLLGAGLMFTQLWFSGSLGLKPPYGHNADLNGVTPLYFSPMMQRIIGGVIAIGMIGWTGFNAGLGGAALSALTRLPSWSGPLLLGIPVLLLSLKGIRMWNRLAAVTTLAVMLLVGMVLAVLATDQSPVRLTIGSPGDLVLDSAVFLGYIGVFSIRAPDFTVGLKNRRELAAANLLLCLPLTAIALAGVALYMGTGQYDLVGILAAPGGLPIGNLLVAISVIAPLFTTLYSGVPSLKAALGMEERAAMFFITIIGLGLAIARFDLKIIVWVGTLAAMLPPLIVPLAVESTRRRWGRSPRMIPLWVSLPGSLLSIGLTLAGSPLALLAGLGLAGVMVFIWTVYKPGQFPIWKER
jgi:cytosine permease